MIERKSQAFLFILLILSIFVIGLAYVIIGNLVTYSYNYTYNDSSVQGDQDYQDFFIRGKTIWTWMLLPIAIAMIAWFVIEVQRKKDMGEFY